MFQARPENGIPTVIPQMYLPGAHPRLKRDRRRAGTDGGEGGNAAVNVSSPINMVPRAFCVRRFLVRFDVYLLLPPLQASLSPKRTPLILCLEFLYARHSRVSAVPRTIIMPPNKRW